MKMKIMAAFLSVVLFANASSSAHISVGGLVSVLVAAGGVIGTVFAFLPSYGDAGHYEVTCGTDVPQCSAPTCGKVEFCYLPSNLGRPFCWQCHGNGQGDGYLAPRQYMGTWWGIPVAAVSIITWLIGTCSVVYSAVKGGSSKDASYENL